MKNIASVLVILLYFTTVSPLISTPTFNITDKYIETGSYALTTLAYFYGNSSWVGLNQTTFTFSLQRNHSNSNCGLVFQELKFELSASYEYNITLKICGFSSPTMTVCLFSHILNELVALRVRYIFLDPGFTKIIIYSMDITVASGWATLNSVTPYIANFGLSMNLTGTTRAFVAWKGFNITAPDSNLTLDLKATASFITSMLLRVRIETTVTANIKFMSASFCYMGYNQGVVAAWPFPSALMNYATFVSSSGSPAVYTDSTNITRDFNTFWGISRINFNSQPIVHFTSDLVPLTSITGTSSTPFNNLDFLVVIFQFKQCDAATPYYMIQNDTCYDICPPRYYGLTNTSRCYTCANYDCYYCSNTGICTFCSNSTDFRVMNSTTNRCVPMTGYYDDGTSNSQAQPCNINCYTCQTIATNCTSCLYGFYLDYTNYTCSPCIPNCLICNNNTSCTMCDQYFSFSSSNLACEIFNCSSIANCTVCNISSGCTQCIVGYNPTNMTTCSPVCGDGYKLSFQACDDNNTINGDGCSFNCIIETAHYCVVNGTASVCGNCSLHCSQCTNQTSCQACYLPYLLNNFTQSCVPDCSLINHCLTCHEPNGTNQTICDTCSLGYVIVNNTCSPLCGDSIVISPEQCDDGNLVNGDGCSSTCTFEINSVCNIVANKSICFFCPAKKYSDSNHANCLNCIYECATCDATGCLSCGLLSHRTLNNVTHRCIPNDGFYDDTVNEVAAPCSTDCLTCSGGTNTTCLSCSSNSVLDNGTCHLCSLSAGLGCTSCIMNASTIVCLNCSSGNLQNGTCLLLAGLPEIPSNMLLLILLPVLLALLCCCLILFLIWRRRKHEQNKVQQDDPSKIISNNIAAEPKVYKIESKKLEEKIQNKDTEGNELSVDEFKEMNDIKMNTPKEKSEMNDYMDSSDQSDFSRQKVDDENASKGCQY